MLNASLKTIIRAYETFRASRPLAQNIADLATEMLGIDRETPWGQIAYDDGETRLLVFLKEDQEDHGVALPQPAPVGAKVWMLVDSSYSAPRLQELEVIGGQLRFGEVSRAVRRTADVFTLKTRKGSRFNYSCMDSRLYWDSQSAILALNHALNRYTEETLSRQETNVMEAEQRLEVLKKDLEETRKNLDDLKKGIEGASSFESLPSELVLIGR